MLRLGQTKGIYLRLRTATFGDFHLTERRVLNTPTRPCKEDDSFSFTGCMLEFIARRVGCHLDWVGRRESLQQPPCLTYQEVSRYSEFLSSLLDYSWIRLTRESGCHGKCRYKQFNFNKVRHTQTQNAIMRINFHFPQLREEIIDWNVNYSSSFYLMAEKTSVEGQEELLVFDPEDLINGIGGALGLFLGWSILYLGKTLYSDN